MRGQSEQHHGSQGRRERQEGRRGEEKRYGKRQVSKNLKGSPGFHGVGGKVRKNRTVRRSHEWLSLGQLVSWLVD